MRVLVEDKEETRARITGDRDIDITPIKRLLSRQAEKVVPKQTSRPWKKDRSLTTPATTERRGAVSSSSRAQSYDSTLVPGSWHDTATLGKPSETCAPIQEEPQSMTRDEVLNPSPDAGVLNTSSSQKYSLSWADTRSPTNWTALELITLKFPSSPEDTNFTVSLLYVLQRECP